MKGFKAVFAMMAVTVALTCAASGCGGSDADDKKEDNWAYAAITLNSADSNVGSVYYVKDYFTTEKINPTTVKNYTEAEITAIIGGAKENAAGYVFDVPDGAVLGMSVYLGDKVFWYGDTAASAIVSHSDALILNAANGDLTSADGTKVASAL